jgi:hypothetical protein
MTLQPSLAHDAWCAWHPTELAGRLSGIARPWCIAGGWALDLWHGHQTRDHEDLEFTVLREDVAAFRQVLTGMDFHAAGDGIVEPLPAGEEPPATIWQIWCQDSVARCWRVDMMIEPGTPDMWEYKRDPAITRPRREMVGMTGDGLPYLRPAAVLLFKAKHRRAKDEIDFAKAVPKLARVERSWLKTCLATAHPGHEWLQML